MRNQGSLFIQLISCLAPINNKARKIHSPLICSKETKRCKLNISFLVVANLNTNVCILKQEKFGFNLKR